MYVQFKEDDGRVCKWQLPGLKPGVYPIVPVKRDWYLDKGKKFPVLRIRRRQLPLTPAFAMTAYASQGQTFKDGVIVDLNIGGSSSTMASYVALTRVQHRNLICRPFPLELFNRGQKSTVDYLLRVWRGEKIDWDKIKDEYMPSKVCAECRCVRK